jgi:hypothetical protein
LDFPDLRNRRDLVDRRAIRSRRGVECGEHERVDTADRGPKDLARHGLVHGATRGRGTRSLDRQNLATGFTPSHVTADLIASVTQLSAGIVIVF